MLVVLKVVSVTGAAFSGVCASLFPHPLLVCSGQWTCVMHKVSGVIQYMVTTYSKGKDQPGKQGEYDNSFIGDHRKSVTFLIN